jgi:hypothetical protein
VIARTQNASGGSVFSRKSQHVGRENLAILGQRIYTRREMLLLDGQKCIGFQSKINRRVLAQALQRRAAARGKFSERLQVNLPPHPVRSISKRAGALAALDELLYPPECLKARNRSKYRDLLQLEEGR